MRRICIRCRRSPLASDRRMIAGSIENATPFLQSKMLKRRPELHKPRQPIDCFGLPFMFW